MNLNQIYNKSIVLREPFLINEEFDLCFLVYNGKLSMLADYFNKMTIEDTVRLVNDVKEDRSSLQIAAFLGFQNIFLYLLTFDADIYYLDDKKQNICHFISYKGEVKNLLILFNFLRFRLKIETLEAIENLKKTYNFSKLDVKRGKLSRAVNHTDSNLKRFDTFQKKLREEAYNLIAKCLKIYQILFSQRDNEGRTPAHYAAMSKYPLCYLIIENFLEFDIFKNNGWDEFIYLFEDLQNLEVKQERMMDPRRCNRLESELSNLLGENILTELAAKFKEGKNEIVKNIINKEDSINDTVLHVASFHGDYRIVNKLLIYNADKTARNIHKKLPVDLSKDNFVRKVLTNLNKAAKNSDSKNLTELVHFGHDINSKLSIFSQAPIHKAIESDKKDKYIVLQKMLDMGADPNTQDSNGWTALHYAAELGDFESIKILLDSKAKIDCFSNNKKTPLHFAASHNFSEIVKYILDKASENNFNLNFFTNKEQLNRKSKDKKPNVENPLTRKKGNKEIDFNPNFHNKTQRNNLNNNNINRNDNQDTLSRKTVNNQINFDPKYSTNHTNHHINNNHKFENQNPLLRKTGKKEIDYEPENKNSIFSYVNSKSARNFYSISTRPFSANTSNFNNSSIITKNKSQLLIDKNDLIFNKKDSNGCTPLHIAAKHGSVESLAILLAFGSDLYSEDFRKWNILHYAAFQGHPKAVRFISRYDSDFSILKNARNSQNKLALEIVRDYTIKHYFNNIWEAVKEGNLDLVKQILNEGENINEISTFLENTPLHLAVFNNHYLMVRLLLDNQAKIDISNKDSISVREYSELINSNISRLYNKVLSEGGDVMNIDINWKEVIRNIINVNEKTLNALITVKNNKVKLWKMMDFSDKINGLLVDYEKNENKLKEYQLTQSLLNQSHSTNNQQSLIDNKSLK